MKKIIMTILVVTVCLSLCSCKTVNQASSFEKSVKLKINICEATLQLSNSNSFVIDSIYSLETMDIENSILFFNKALELVKNTKENVDDSISCPNFISEELYNLEENYERTIDLLSKSSEISEEEMNEIVNLLGEGTSTYIFSFNSLYAFSYLYEIREFDQFYNEPIQNNLKDNLWKFGFNDDIELPETISKQDLYLIWARQYFGSFNEDKFLEELQTLRKNDDLSSQDFNQKWTEFIKNFILETDEGILNRNTLSFIYIIKKLKLIKIPFFCTGEVVIYNFFGSHND